MMKIDVMKVLPTVNLAVCGRFHYHNYVQYLHKFGFLNRFFYATRFSEKAKRLGILNESAFNGFLSAYAINLHIKLFGDRWWDTCFSVYHDWWQRYVLRNWSKANLFHIMLHGNASMLIAKAHSEGVQVICEPVNSHPTDLSCLLDEEYERLKITSRGKLNLLEKRRADEALKCNYLLAGSQFVVDSFVRNGFPADKTKVIPYGVDLHYFKPLTDVEHKQQANGLKSRQFRVICVAGIHPRKGHIYLLEAWKRMSLLNAELLFIGHLSEDMKPVLAPYIDYFRHIEHIPHHTLRKYYCNSDLFVLPSIEDGFAYVCAEAMGCGLPVVATENTGAAELIDEGVTGYRVPIRSPEALADKISVFYNNREKIYEMGLSAKEKARHEMNWEIYARSLIQFYSEVFEERLSTNSLPVRNNQEGIT
jgi:glycosyltransferase involved in cell wall biosynthesis